MQVEENKRVDIQEPSDLPSVAAYERKLLTGETLVSPHVAKMMNDLGLGYNREVVVFTPIGSYLDPSYFGKYKNPEIAYTILANFPETEFKMFYLDSGEEVFKH